MNIDTIAKELNTSAATVSRALRNCNGVNEKTRMRIVSYADKIGYAIPKAESVHNVALILPGETIDDLHELASRYMVTIGHELTKLNWPMHVVPIHFHSHDILTSKATWPKILKNNIIDSCIIIDTIPSEARRLIADHFKNRVVMVSRYYLEDGISGVAISNYSGGCHAAEKILEHKHKSIGWIGSLGSEDVSRRRYFGVQSVLMQKGIKLEREIWLDERNQIDSDLETQISYITKTSLTTAWIASNDWLAAKFITKMEKKGFTCPEDYELICFDNTKISEILAQRKLSTIASPVNDLARESVVLLQRLINEKEAKPKAWLYATEFQQGETFSGI